MRTNSPKEQAHVQPSGHASNVDIPQHQQPVSGSGSAGLTSGSYQQRKRVVKYVQPVSASWACHVTTAKNKGEHRPRVDGLSGDTKRGSGDTANKSSSGEGQVQSVRHCSQSTAHKRRKRVGFASAAEVAAAAVAAAATTPVVPAPAAAGLHPAQAAMLLSQLQYQRYAAHLAAGTRPHYPVGPMLSVPPPPPPSPTPSSQGCTKRSRTEVYGGDVTKAYQGSASTYSNFMPSASYGSNVMEVHHKLDEICQHFMAIKDVHLQQAAALLIAPPTTTRVAAPVPLPHRGKPSRTRGSQHATDKEAAARAFDKALQIIQSSLKGMVAPPAEGGATGGGMMPSPVMASPMVTPMTGSPPSFAPPMTTAACP